MGILLMNVVSFAMPSGAYFNPTAIGTPSAADLAIWAAAFVLVDGKMRALFSILFGASTLIVVTRAARAGEDPARVHLSRMGVLAAFGTLHWLLLWPGDILLHYAIIGTIALPFTTLTPRQQVKIALMLLLGQAAAQGWLLATDLSLHARAATGAPDAIASWRDFMTAVGVGAPADLAREVALHRGSYAPLLAAHLHDLAAGTPFLLVFNGPETLAYLLLGMAALASGFLSGGWTRRRYARAATIALGIGLPASTLLAVLAGRAQFETIATFAAATLGGVPLRPLIAFGYAAALIPWLTGDGTFRRRLGAAGRCAFSNYLGTSLVMAAICDGWGLGLYGRLSRAEAYLLVPPGCAAMLLLSPAWLRHHHHGPLEWLWRSLARWHRGPFTQS